jgi:predicted secreted hydrolase
LVRHRGASQTIALAVILNVAAVRDAVEAAAPRLAAPAETSLATPAAGTLAPLLATPAVEPVAASLPTPVTGGAAPTQYAAVTADQPVAFPRDFGSHPNFRTEWWYVTGWLTTDRGDPLGFQITFFRTKPAMDSANPSAFTPHQLLIAHAAVSDPHRGRLWQDQRLRRAGLGLADAAQDDTRVWIDDWSLERDGGLYKARLKGDGFSFDLTLTDTQAPIRNGTGGVSRKGPAPQSASYYYSVPHLKVAGALTRDGAPSSVVGEAWLDHEWSSEYLDTRAVGWDWIGINLADGSALMAFRMRDVDGGVLWAGGSLRSGDGTLEVLSPPDVRFDAERYWVSPRTGTRYPVQWRVTAGSRQFDLRPLLDDQENDTRLSTGAIYWEGAVRAYEANRQVGLGYLELTGYGDRLELR